LRKIVRLALPAAILGLQAAAQTFDPSLFQEMAWREIGPYRGGRTRALSGVPSQPSVFYVGAVDGGVWKTDDYGRTWKPIFDHEPSGSIGAIAVAPSDPSILYVGSGEGLQRPDLSTGDGLYKSDNGGETWTHLGLRDGQQIAHLAVDPTDPNRILVAVMGHPYGPNTERGVFLSTDGGKTVSKVLYKDENTGANDVEIDPKDPRICYAALWEARQGPWENSEWSGTHGGIFKSTDRGVTWAPLKNGLPEGVIQANLAIAASDPNRLFAAVATQQGVAIYRSDNKGERWDKITGDERPAERIGGGDLPVPAVDPQNVDVVYSASIVTWKSTDGGKTWNGLRGAPGGDDYQSIWINPNNSKILLIVSDQGAIITVNGGETWSSWYNQPTAQMYHASADNAFPYRVCGGQQESGSACVASRGNDGEITFRDWHPVGAEEYGYVAPDPLNPDLVYGGKLTRYDRRTGQTAEVGPKPLRQPGYRVLRTQPVVFSPIDPHVLYFAANTIWKTRDGGEHWQQISPDLSRKTWEVPANVGIYKDRPTAAPTQRGVVYSLAPSPLEMGRLWAGTDDGLIHLTTDGGLHWQNVTPPELKPFAKVSIIEAGRFDKSTAYAAINTLRLDDLRPHILRTHDDGKTWTEIVNGIPDGAPINVVREDPKRQGLLFAGSETQVYVSFDDGDHWQPLRLNMPATSIRDVIVKDDDLIAATHGRGFWILDDITPLRQLKNGETGPVVLFKPQTATRVRWDTNTDTPLPPDEPAGKNPPDGAAIDFYLNGDASGVVTLDILDRAAKTTIRSYSSDRLDEKVDLEKLQVPTYWARQPRRLPTGPGLHRVIWDMHYPSAAASGEELPMQAVFEETEPANHAPWVLPGAYLVRLTVDGKSYEQPLIVKMDPRVKTPLAGLTEQFVLSKKAYDGVERGSSALKELQAWREKLRDSSDEQAKALDKKLEDMAGRKGARFGGGGRLAVYGPATLTSVTSALETLLAALQDADVAPTSQQQAALTAQLQQMNTLMARLDGLKKESGSK
jgi:photosystem II stability/assembly factor-like uncharacterized protein